MDVIFQNNNIFFLSLFCNFDDIYLIPQLFQWLRKKELNVFEIEYNKIMNLSKNGTIQWRDYLGLIEWLIDK